MTSVLTYVLILGTWVMWVGAAAGWGMLLGRLVRLPVRPARRFVTALWAGLGAIAIGAAALNLALPLGGTGGSVAAVAVVAGGWLFLALDAWRRWPSAPSQWAVAWREQSLPVLLFLTFLLVALALLPPIAAGEPMDGDTGLYRLGAINYASDYPLVPGLANLQDRFGFNTSMSPLAALMGTGLWAGEGFRLVIGLLITALIVSTGAQVFSRPGGLRAGDWFAVIGTCFTLAILLTDAGRWIASPVQDVGVLVFAVVSTAFLLDFVQGRHEWSAGVSAVFAGAVAASVRPLAWVLAGVTLLVVSALVLQRTRGRRLRRRRAASTLGWSAAAFLVVLAVMLIRDVILSGWLLFPLSLFPVDVPWRSKDPTITARWVSSWARMPGLSPDVVLADYAWVRPWFAGFRASREAYLSVLLLMGAVAPCLWPRGRRALRRSRGCCAWALRPPWRSHSHGSSRRRTSASGGQASSGSPVYLLPWCSRGVPTLEWRCSGSVWR